MKMLSSDWSPKDKSQAVCWAWSTHSMLLALQGEDVARLIPGNSCKGISIERDNPFPFCEQYFYFPLFSCSRKLPLLSRT